jgi:hypothetical protein
MKKLFCLFAVVVIALSFSLPMSDVSAKVISTTITLSAEPRSMIVCAKEWSSGGVTHWRDCTVAIYYYSPDDIRIQGLSNIVMHRNIFAEDAFTTNPLAFGLPAVGHGSWVLTPEAVEDGYWAGTFTANIDDAGDMTVYLRGKGYGTLDGLFWDSVVYNMVGTSEGVITELPSYDGPEP